MKYLEGTISTYKQNLISIKDLACLACAIESVTGETIERPHLMMSLLDGIGVYELEAMIVNYSQGQEIVNKWRELRN